MSTPVSASTRSELALLVGSMILQHQSEHLITVGGPVKAEPAISGVQPVPQMSHPRRHYF